ncbi:hypothetical protein SDC9_162231 [bioreactor metagenome]|uniref:Uncharacterized protein n=1 Tax=bioreactor metagenome TaxID=1076179 RepID=A0A645FMV6_9ZZZZ
MLQRISELHERAGERYVVRAFMLENKHGEEYYRRGRGKVNYYLQSSQMRAFLREFNKLEKRRRMEYKIVKTFGVVYKVGELTVVHTRNGASEYEKGSEIKV